MAQTPTDYEQTHQRRLFQVKIAFLVAGFLSFLLSVFLYFLVDEQQGIYVGLWVPSIWALGALTLSTETRKP
jgi:hypothetical protein